MINFIIDKPELFVLLLNIFLLIVSYLLIYPKVCKNDLQKIQKYDVFFSLLWIIIVWFLFWWTDINFNLVFIDLNWFWFQIITYIFFEIIFFFWYMKKENISMEDYLNINNRSKVNLKYFWNIILDKEYRIENIDFNNSKISIDLNFDEKLKNKDIEILNTFLEKLEKIEDKVLKAILYDFENKSVDEYGVKFYIKHHLEELEDDDLNWLINIKKWKKEEQLLNILKVKRIWIYADDLDSYAIFDYTISEEFTDELITVYMKATTEINDIVIES
jgi:Ca2+/Na+ antiporter